MQVNEVEVRLYDNNKTRAFLTIHLGDDHENKMILKDWVLIEGKNGMFAASPSREYDGKWYNQTIVLDDWRQKINDAAIAAYNREKGNVGANTGQDSHSNRAAAGRANSRNNVTAPF